MKNNAVYYLAGLAVVGAPLFVFLLRGMVSGKRYVRARWPIVAVYYALVGIHEAVAHLGVPVGCPMMILVVLAPLLALVLLDASPRRSRSSERERRGFPVGPAQTDDES